MIVVFPGLNCHHNNFKFPDELICLIFNQQSDIITFDWFVF